MVHKLLGVKGKVCWEAYNMDLIFIATVRLVVFLNEDDLPRTRWEACTRWKARTR